jgi:hypothetical protein
MCLEKILSSNSDYGTVSIRSFFFRNRKWKISKYHVFKIAPTFLVYMLKLVPVTSMVLPHVMDGRNYLKNGE